MASNSESITSSLITEICQKATVSATKNVYETVQENVRKCHRPEKPGFRWRSMRVSWTRDQSLAV